MCFSAESSSASGNVKLLPHSRLKTNYANDNEELMATVRYSSAALKRWRKEIELFRVFLAFRAHAKFKTSGETYLVPVRKFSSSSVFLFFFVRCFVNIKTREKAFRNTKCNFSSATTKMEMKNLAVEMQNLYHPS